MDSEFLSYDFQELKTNYNVGYIVVVLPERGEADYYNGRIRIHLEDLKVDELFYRVEIHAFAEFGEDYDGWYRTYRSFQEITNCISGPEQKVICVFSKGELMKVNEIRRSYNSGGSATISVSSPFLGIPIATDIVTVRFES